MVIIDESETTVGIGVREFMDVFEVGVPLLPRQGESGILAGGFQEIVKLGDREIVVELRAAGALDMPGFGKIPVPERLVAAAPRQEIEIEAELRLLNAAEIPRVLEAVEGIEPPLDVKGTPAEDLGGEIYREIHIVRECLIERLIRGHLIYALG